MYNYWHVNIFYVVHKLLKTKWEKLRLISSDNYLTENIGGWNNDKAVNDIFDSENVLLENFNNGKGTMTPTRWDMFHLQQWLCALRHVVVFNYQSIKNSYCSDYNIDYWD